MRIHKSHPNQEQLIASWAEVKYRDVNCVMVIYLESERPQGINILLKSLAKKKQSYDMDVVEHSDYVFIPFDSLSTARTYGEFISEWFKSDIIIRGEYLNRG